MDIQYFYSLVLICLLSANAYASTTSPAPSPQGPTSVAPASTTVATDSSSAVAASSSIAPGTSNTSDTTPPTTTTTNAANASSTSVASQPDISTTNIPSASTSATPVETSSNIPSSSTSSSSVNYSGTSNDVTSPGPRVNSSVSPTSPSSTSNSSLSTVDTTPTTTFISSVNPGSTSDASVNSSSATSASASSVTASNSASSTASPTPVLTNSSTSEEGASTSTPSSPSGSPASNASATPVESSTGGTSAGSDTNTSDSTTASGSPTTQPQSSTPSTNPSSSAASDSSPASTDSTTSSQPTSTDAPVESTTVTPAAPVEITQPPLSTSFPSFAANTDVARYQLSLAFDGDNNGPTTSCNDSSLQTELEDRLKTTDGYSEVIRTSSKKFSAVYQAKHLYGRMANVTTKQLEVAMSTNPSCFNYTAFNDSFQQAFGKFAALTDDYCKAEDICNTGYTCRDRQGSPVCISLCEGFVCQNDGACVVVVKQDGQAAAQCRCTDNNEQVFSGDKCEVARMNPDRVAAIVGAVLGAFCFILLVALYCMCYRKRERSGQKYHLSGVYNETYDRASLDMKTL